MRSILVALALVAAACSPCETIGPALSEACTPASMASDTEIEIEVREDCGTSCSEEPDCAAVVDLNTVTIVASQTECRQDCTPDGSCRRRTARCLIPALSPGDYQVVIPGVGTRTLRAEPGAPATCTL